jgi:hypothetical protein
MKRNYQDFDQVPFEERSKWAIPVWIGQLLACLAFWRTVFYLIFGI